MNSNTVKLVAAIAILAVAAVLIAWQFGVFESKPQGEAAQGGIGVGEGGEPAGGITEEGEVSGVNFNKPDRNY